MAVDKTLRFVEEPVEIIDREVKSLKRSRIALVKVRWNCKRGPEFTWERENYMKSKYAQLFLIRADEPIIHEEFVKLLLNSFGKLSISLRPDWIHQRGEYAFQFLFGTEFQSFKKIFDNSIDQLKEQLDKEELMSMFPSMFSSASETGSPDAKREKQEKKENCSKKIQELKMVVLVINPRQLFAKKSEFAFEVLFGEDYDSFAYKFYHNLARLENQLSRVENHEGDSKTYLVKLKKQCEAFLTYKNPKSLELSMFSYYMEVFQKYTLYDIKSTKNMLVSCLNAIEKEIDARAHHEDKLARVYDSRADGPDIRLSNDTKPLHEVQSTVSYNEDANDRQHAEQPKFINEGKVGQDAEQFTTGIFQKLRHRGLLLKLHFSTSIRNDSLKTLQKENENFLASLKIENAHLKQTYKDLYESFQRSNVQSNQCDEVKVKVNFDEIETNNIELEHRVSSLLKENEQLKLVYKYLFDSIKKTRVHKENLRATLSEFLVNHICGKEDSSPSSTNELEKESGENTCDNAKFEFQTKFIELEKVLTQQTKDFNDVKLELSNKTAKFEAYFEKLEKTKVVLERQLARKVDDSKAEKDEFLKEINHLRT
ncbi:hypothetical protein Tco_0451065 [Tanacetum coccineum]